jgi:hypothetical protein
VAPQELSLLPLLLQRQRQRQEEPVAVVVLDLFSVARHISLL